MNHKQEALLFINSLIALFFSEAAQQRLWGGKNSINEIPRNINEGSIQRDKIIPLRHIFP
jgi:hypothetical protein